MYLFIENCFITLIGNLFKYIYTNARVKIDNLSFEDGTVRLEELERSFIFFELL